MTDMDLEGFVVELVEMARFRSHVRADQFDILFCKYGICPSPGEFSPAFTALKERREKGSIR